MKKQYVSPAIEELGRFESMTKATNAGTRLDDNFAGVVAPLILS